MILKVEQSEAGFDVNSIFWLPRRESVKPVQMILLTRWWANPVDAVVVRRSSQEKERDGSCRSARMVVEAF
ncbi:unnamed protein product [Fusarium venenatum]|uniref:Uncharacterized protein n=1 Tax=Fusarium venenatum TaxID=56646 RepID=A0A2L2SWJ7_9HYPO|nr:uncharacterized protein FVRRES_05514 [Fusarium venenatum]CEI61078.1 unnamed protein product [Fusarium venenatum]